MLGKPAPEPWITITPTPVTTSTVESDGDWVSTILASADRYLPFVLITTTLAVIAVAAGVVWTVTRRRRDSTKSRIHRVLVFLAAIIGSAFTIHSMWRVLEHTLGITSPAVRAVLCGVFEIMMLASAINSRRFRLLHAEKPQANDGRRAVDVDGIATWVFAAVAGWICWADSTSTVEAVMRGFLPLAVAWMWERAIAADLRTYTRQVRQRRVRLRIGWEQLLVWLRLADTSTLSVDEQDRARYQTAFAVAAYRLHVLAKDNAPAWAVRFARWRFRRIGIKIMRRFGVTELAAARTHVAVLHEMERHMSPDAVTGLTPWGTVTDAPSPVTGDGNTGDVTGTRRAITAPSPVTNTTTPVTDAPSPVTGDGGGKTVTGSVTVDGNDGDSGDVVTVTRAGNGTVTVTKTVNDGITTVTVNGVTVTQVAEEQAKRLATQYAHEALEQTGEKTVGLLVYFEVCRRAKVQPVGAQAARAVRASEGLARQWLQRWRTGKAVVIVTDAPSPSPSLACVTNGTVTVAGSRSRVTSLSRGDGDAHTVTSSSPSPGDARTVNGVTVTPITVTPITVSKE